jgi:transcriptional regulator with XRE-family HTH domain
VDRAYISELERKQGNASMDILDKLAAVLGVAHAELLRAPRMGDQKPEALRVGRRAKAR